MRIYLAGPLFTQAERTWNAALAEGLRSLGHDVFLPQEAIGSLDRLEADPIFELDCRGVRTSQAVVAILDGADADSGTCFECGLAFGLGLPIVAVRTDFRGGGDALPGQKLATVNLMLAQAATTIVHLADPGLGLSVVIDRVHQALGSLPQAPR